MWRKLFAGIENTLHPLKISTREKSNLPELERSCRFFGFTIRGYQPSFERREISRQLALRDHFPAEQWQNHGFDVYLAEEIAFAFNTELDWPNHHFLPNDSTVLLFTLRIDDFPSLNGLNAVQKRLHIRLEYRLVQDSYEYDWPFMTLVRRILNAMKQEND